MVRRLDALPMVARGKLSLEDCVTMQVVHEGPIVRTVYWHCREDGPAQRAERRQTAYVLSLIERGACQVHYEDSTLTVDATTALTYRPGAAYHTTHPFGFDEQRLEPGVPRGCRARDAGSSRAEPRSVAALEFAADEPNAGAGCAPEDFGRANQTRSSHRRHGDGRGQPRDVRASASPGRPGAREQSARGSTSKRHRRIVEQACEYLNVHFADSIPLERLATAVGVSPAHLCRVFKKQTGLAIRHYLRRLRLAAALDDLAREDHSLARVAVENGFYSHSHLTSAFAEVLGSTPSEVRPTAVEPGAVLGSQRPRSFACRRTPRPYPAPIKFLEA